jgi:large subunit ribosomal protein L6
MSRIGKKPVDIPQGVDVKLDGNTITVKGPKDTLTMTAHSDMAIKIENNQIIVERPSDEKKHKALHGLTRSLVHNMVEGVSTGFKKSLDIQGIGFKAIKQGKIVTFNLGYSHTIEVPEPAGITIEVPAPNKIVVVGADKQLVGETAAKIRALRVPDAYKGKGIKYDFEVLKLKEGKTGAKGK